MATEVRKRLARDLLVITGCCFVWLVFITAAEDPNPPVAADVTPLERSSNSRTSETPGGAGELSLFADTSTTAAQTKPEDPKAALRTGVTVSSSSAMVNRGVVPDRAQPPASGVVVPRQQNDSMRQRQDRLSFGSEAALADRPVRGAGRVPLGGSGVSQGPVLEVYAADRSERTPGTGTPQVTERGGAGSAVPQQRQVFFDTPVSSGPSSMPQSSASSKPAQPMTAQLSKPMAQPAKPVAQQPLKPTPPATKQNVTSDSSPAFESSPTARAVAQQTGDTEGSDGGVSLRDHFSAAPANSNDSVVFESKPHDSEVANGQGRTGNEIISSKLPEVTSGAVPAQSSASLAEAINRGDVGRDVPAVPPFRIGALLILMAGLIAFAVWSKNRSGRNPFGLLRQKSVTVIETISIAPGRQIVLIELRGSALVLGVTPQSINLLDKVPLELLEENYQPTVQQIIHREGRGRSNWEARPQYKVAAVGGSGPVGPSVPPLYNSYGPPPQGRMSVAELRQQHATGKTATSSGGFHSYREGASPQPPRLGELRVTQRLNTPAHSSESAGEPSKPGKTELLESLREQLRKLEE